ncbi:MAG: AEC family transporter [Oscillospiraceae bacterium]|nr:AEC family transporter [Oscillospiraceae bacterium]
MNNLVFSLNATMPVFLVILAGYIFNRMGMFKEGFVPSCNKFIFNVCLPIMVFADLAKENIVTSFNGSLVIYSAVITIIAFAVIWICARLFIKDRSIIGAFVQASYRSSVAVMGFAFMQNIYGSTGLIPMIIIGCVPLYNICAVTVLTFEAEDSRNDPDEKNKLKKAAIGIITNPIILGIIAGCIGSLLNVYSYIPPIIDKTLNSLSAIATPLSLIVIGASFEGRKAIAKLKPTAVCCAVKLIAMPLVFLTAAILMGFRDEALLALVIMLGSPTTPSCYIMAKNMKNDGVLTSSVIAATTLLSSVTLTFWIFIVKFMGYIS